jgi:hypothetical protein
MGFTFFLFGHSLSLKLCMSEGARIFKNIDGSPSLRITVFSQNIPCRWQPASPLEAIAARTLHLLQ